MKKCLILSAALLSVLLLTACQNASFDGSRTGDASHLLMDYKIFNGTDSQLLELEKGDVIDGELVVEAGQLSVKIQKADDKPIYDTENIFFSNTCQIPIEEDGTYKLTVTGEKAAGSIRFEKNTKMDALLNSYYEGQDSRAFKMFNKSIFKNLASGWTAKLGDIENPKWNYDTFTKYTLLDEDKNPEAKSDSLYCCTFSAENRKYGYAVISYDGDSLSLVRAEETPYLFDMRKNMEGIKTELNYTKIHSASKAARVQISNGEDTLEGIYISDDEGNHYVYNFN